ncbi:hypothetical protein VNO77_02045 [Canavalia gladiata]|uniref:glucose-1-phosphate adenylyltransferase n=1 Tax=Canavalia gladiata TaxID=3824 RepID=A0AAN9MSW9_CANGL
MDYMDFVQNHRESMADITLSCLPMDDSRASDFGLMKIDSKGRILSFSEKPKGEDLKAMQVDTMVLGLSQDEAEKKPYIASMGVYVFKKEILLNLLRWRFQIANDFGSGVIPASAREFYMKASLFNDYWEDVGTIRSFFEANRIPSRARPRHTAHNRIHVSNKAAWDSLHPRSREPRRPKQWRFRLRIGARCRLQRQSRASPLHSDQGKTERPASTLACGGVT